MHNAFELTLITGVTEGGSRYGHLAYYHVKQSNCRGKKQSKQSVPAKSCSRRTNPNKQQYAYNSHETVVSLDSNVGHTGARVQLADKRACINTPPILTRPICGSIQPDAADPPILQNFLPPSIPVNHRSLGELDHLVNLIFNVNVNGNARSVTLT